MCRSTQPSPEGQDLSTTANTSPTRRPPSCPCATPRFLDLLENLGLGRAGPRVGICVFFVDPKHRLMGRTPADVSPLDVTTPQYQSASAKRILDLPELLEWQNEALFRPADDGGWGLWKLEQRR